METAERGLGSVLSWEVEQELTEFVSKEGFKGGNPSGAAAARQGRANNSTNGRGDTSPLPPMVNVDSPTDEFGSQSGNRGVPVTTPVRPRAGTHTDAQSVRSGRAESFSSSRQGEGRSGGGGGFLSAFKSGGNKLDRRKSTAQPQQQQQQRQGGANGADSDDERDAFRSSGSASAGRPSRDRQQSMRSSGAGSDDEFDTSRSGSGGGGLRVGGGGGKSKRESFMPGFLKRKTTNARRDSFSERQQQQQPASNSYSQRDTSTTPRASDQPRTAPPRTTSFDDYSNASPAPVSRDRNNIGFDETEEIGMPAMLPDAPKTAPMQSPIQSLNPFAGAMGAGAAGSNSATPIVDEQGYSVPPADYNKPAWATGSGGGDLMDMPDSDEEYVLSHDLCRRETPGNHV